MNINLTGNQLNDFKDFILPSLPPNPNKGKPVNDLPFTWTGSLPRNEIGRMQFGSVRLGGIERLWEGKLHPMVIVEEHTKEFSPALQLRPGTSIRKSGPGVLCLPKGAIRLNKKGKGYVPTYVYCFLKLRVATDDVRNMQFINNLDKEYHEPLRKCLKEVRG